MTMGSADPGPPPPVPGPMDGSLAMLLVLVGRRLRNRLEEDLSEHGLSLRYVSALGHLAHEPGLSYSQLARRAGVSAQSMQATLSRLEELGAVARDTPSGRGRAAALQVTGQGAALIERGRRVIAALDGELAPTLSLHQRREVTVALLTLLAPR